MGIIGSYEGWYAGDGIIYNRGSWGSGYSTSNLSAYNVPSGFSISISSEPSAVKIHSSGNDKLTYNHVCIKLNKAINFSAYKTVNFILSGCAGGRWNSHGQWFEQSLFCSIMNTSGKSAVATSFKGDGYEPDVVEHTITMDISTLNITGYLCMEFIDISEYGGLGLGRYNTTSYIHMIKLS